MKLDKDHINSIIHGNSRFLSAYSDPAPYFMYTRKGYTEDFEKKIIDIYYDKLRYAVQNAEKLVIVVYWMKVQFLLKTISMDLQ